MKWIFVLAFAFTLGNVNAAQNYVEKGGLKWYNDLEEVHKLSNESKKPIFGFFTGSDWCGWCHKLQREVFAKQVFIDWAKANVILMEIDFPRRTKQSPELVTQNQNLQRAFRVTGYPTVWLFTSKKDESNGGFNLSSIGKLGYPRVNQKGQEAAKFLEEANRLLSAKK